MKTASIVMIGHLKKSFSDNLTKGRLLLSILLILKYVDKQNSMISDIESKVVYGKLYVIDISTGNNPNAKPAVPFKKNARQQPTSKFREKCCQIRLGPRPIPEVW